MRATLRLVISLALAGLTAAACRQPAEDAND